MAFEYEFPFGKASWQVRTFNFWIFWECKTPNSQIGQSQDGTLTTSFKYPACYLFAATAMIFLIGSPVKTPGHLRVQPCNMQRRFFSSHGLRAIDMDRCSHVNHGKPFSCHPWTGTRILYTYIWLIFCGKCR